MCLACAINSIVTDYNTCNDTTSLHNDNHNAQVRHYNVICKYFSVLCAIDMKLAPINSACKRDYIYIYI